MKLFLLAGIAAAANILTSLTLYYFDHALPSEYAHIADNLIEWVWGSSIICSIVIAIFNRKQLFKGMMILWTSLILLFCTPVPFFVIIRLMNPMPETILMTSDYEYPVGKVEKNEHWQYSYSDQKYVDKHFLADSLAFEKRGERSFKEDGKWIYFNKNGDTLKVESYVDGKLTNRKTRSTD
jgi:hypothetical protein